MFSGIKNFFYSMFDSVQIAQESASATEVMVKGLYEKLEQHQTRMVMTCNDVEDALNIGLVEIKRELEGIKSGLAKRKAKKQILIQASKEICKDGR